MERRNEKFVVKALIERLGLQRQTAELAVLELDEQCLHAIAWEVQAKIEDESNARRHELLDIVAPGPRSSKPDPTIEELRRQGYEIKCCCDKLECEICFPVQIEPKP